MQSCSELRWVEKRQPGVYNLEKDFHEVQSEPARIMPTVSVCS